MNLLDDFPKTELEFHRRFASEAACVKYFCALRWPDGFVCPYCNHKGGWLRKKSNERRKKNKRPSYVCRACKAETSVTAGTVLHNTQKELREWLLAMFHRTVSKQGMSALELQRRMGFGCYRTALRWLRELRRAMGEALKDRQQLGPEVEVDEVPIAGFQEEPRASDKKKDAYMLVAVERLPSGCGRVRLKFMRHRDGAHVIPFIKSVVKPGSLVLTDWSGAFVTLTNEGYLHDARVTSNGHGKQLRTPEGLLIAAKHLPRIGRIANLVDRLMIGAHQGSFKRRHIQGYLDEYAFRFDGKNLNVRTRMVKELAEAALAIPCLPYTVSTGEFGPKKNRRQAEQLKQLAGEAYGNR